MRAVVCPDKFRGSLSAVEAASCIVEGLREAGVHDTVALPMADGGEGTLDAMLAAAGGERRETPTVDALGRPVVGSWGVLGDGTAVVEAATSIGLAQLGDLRDAVGADSTGLGHVLSAVLDARPPRLLVVVGGVATTDGGLGCLDVLGWDLRGVETVVACDVDVTFVDAARLFAPQKGADGDDVVALTARLEALAARYAAHGRDVASLAGSGAAGGLAGGLAAVGARLAPGFDVVADLVGLPQLVARADLVVTGEGRLDATSLRGKVVGGVLRLAAGSRAVAVVLAGAADEGTSDRLRSDGVVVATVRDLAADDTESFTRAGELLTTLAQRTVDTLAS